MFYIYPQKAPNKRLIVCQTVFERISKICLKAILSKLHICRLH